MNFLTPEFLLLFLLLGALAGFLAGLLGVGGGIILIPLFLWAFPVAGFPAEIVVHVAFGTSLAIIIPTAVSSTFGHRKRGNVDWRQVGRMALGGVVGVVIGSTLAASLSGDFLRSTFGLMQIGVGLKMFLYRPHLPPEETDGLPLARLLFTGFTVGAFSSFFGVGGGIVAVPMMVILLRLPIHLAVGNSSALMVISALFGAISYVAHGWGHPHLPLYSLGFVHQIVALIIAPVSMIFARLGIKLASRTPHDRLLRIFAAFLILVGGRMAFF